MRERRILELLLGSYVATLLVPAAALLGARTGGTLPGVGVLLAGIVLLASLVAIAARRVEDLAGRLASIAVAAATVLPPFAYLPYLVLVASPGSPGAFVSVVGLLSILPGIAVPVGGAVIRNRRLREDATEIAEVTVGDGDDERDEGWNWAVVAGSIVMGLAFVLYGVLVLLEGDVEVGSTIGVFGGLSGTLPALAGDDDTELSVTDAGLRIDRSFTPWTDLEGYRVTDEAIELVRPEWYHPTRSFERDAIDDGDEEVLIEALGRFLPRLDERGRAEVGPGDRRASGAAGSEERGRVR